MDEIEVGFIIAGVQKAATSALFAYLRDHPHLSMAPKKEVHFFDTEENFAAGMVDYRRYHEKFHFRPDAKLYGEATPVYAYWHDAPRRMWQYNPRLKVILLLRDPIRRAFSNWNMERLRGSEKLSFSEAIRAEPQRVREALPLQHRLFSYVDRGFYSEQVRRMWRFFPPEQTLILKSEDLRRQPQATIDRVCDFLAIDRMTVTQEKTPLALPYLDRLQEADVAYLERLYRYDVRQLETMLGWDCSEWLRP